MPPARHIFLQQPHHKTSHQPKPPIQPSPLRKMPQASQKSPSIHNMQKMLCLHITQAAFEDPKDINAKSSIGTDSDVQDLVLALAAIKKQQYLAERV
ncbi:hypothetical protein VP01_8331g1 [Puccinia sorghi]|uniref:Uncharacterized protein n=1 Tax=Puccinia sorghi TaxID=27349 RepID=A0A0L6U9R5_9BASI|nr:hypothetical protein VP01_8331g1 [Puccinia sorghi]